MKLGNKIIAIALSAIAVSVSAGLFVQNIVIHEQGIDLTRETMREALIEAENVRASISRLGERGAFDRAKLLEEYKRSPDPRATTLYDTIPVVAAWRAVEAVAEDKGWKFRVPKHQARNEKNKPTPEEEVILAALEKGDQEEYFKIDRDANTAIFARPIKLRSL